MKITPPTAFEQKLTAYQAGQRSTTDPGYKRAVWNLMIACGGASHYKRDRLDGEDRSTHYHRTRDLVGQHSEAVETGLDRTLQFFEKIEAGLVDYDASDDPDQGHGHVFNGTFADEQGSYPYLAGRLRFTDGTWTWWAVKVGGDGCDFGAVLRAITALDLTDAEAAEHLESRITAPNAGDWDFRYTCELPEM